MTTAQTRLAATRDLETALAHLSEGNDMVALAHAEHAASLLDRISGEPRLTFERQASHYVSLWLTNDEASYKVWKGATAETMRANLDIYAREFCNSIRKDNAHSQTMRTMANALAELLTRAVAWLDYDAIAAQLQED